ncbi:diguanylate cyclase/phosphodiesterase with PAS/PAC and GAF sensor(s) [Caballeronia fortuita]|uniref:Diguanylate cyclase/phosphodiesterase with PAS/PAC and GAF sensor(S) n=1 Tax=Caballeronia fortuita TaxID=1777138 RepID=A0A158DXS3_9BURK|nr:EAL domain-containing protein [Caballeronia fortuita]SAK99412.1 diguanylate cyclase/phosphodiesterase with PAS/PAC and GAF sensor(s) [Caballeronia fortuita]
MNDKTSIRLAPDDASRKCAACRLPAGEIIDLAFAFQPIVDVRTGVAYAHEALVRGPNGESAGSVLARIDDANRYHFDQRCRAVAIEQAASLGMSGYLSINFMPNAVYQPEACIRSTFEAAEKFQFSTDRIIFETVEGENIISRPHLVEIFRAYRRFGFQTAIDDFGAGYSGLTLLTEFQPDLIKLDMELVRGIDTDSVRQSIVRGVLSMCRDLGIRVIAEGIETIGERDFFVAHGVDLLQGYLFAKPAFRSLPASTGDWLAA